MTWQRWKRLDVGFSAFKMLPPSPQNSGRPVCSCPLSTGCRIRSPKVDEPEKIDIENIFTKANELSFAHLSILSWYLQGESQPVGVEAVVEGDEGAVDAGLDQIVGKILEGSKFISREQ